MSKSGHFASTSAFNTLGKYECGWHFEVSAPREAALEKEVCRDKPFHYEPPWVLGPQQCQSCMSYTNRGGYDAQKWKR